MNSTLLALLTVGSLIARDDTAVIGYLADPHVCEGVSSAAWTASVPGGVNTNRDQWGFMVDWMCDQGADAITVAGDLTVSDGGVFTDGCTQRFKAEFESWIAGRADLLPVVGNHDTEDHWQSGGGGSDSLNANPFYAMQDSFPNLYREGRAFYSRDFGPVRIMAINNLADTTIVSGGNADQHYANCNPPYRGTIYWSANGYPTGRSDYTNPDYTGLTNGWSGQRLWIRRALADSWPPFKVLAMHRGVFTPFPDTTSNRPSFRGMRYTVWKEATEAGADLAIQGDQHIVAWSKRIATDASGYEVSTADSSGLMSVALHGHYFRRGVDTSAMPAGSLIFSKGDTDSAGGKWIYGMLMRANGNRAELSLVRTAQGPGPTYALRIVEVAKRVILANGGRDF